jgi:hypothetical protein
MKSKSRLQFQVIDIETTPPLMENLEWNSTFFVFSIIIEGTTEKVLKLIMPLKSTYNKNLGFIEQKKPYF